MHLAFLSFALMQVVFAAFYLIVPEQIDPPLRSFEDALFYSIQTQARVGESQFVAVGMAARILTTVQIYAALYWFTASVFYHLREAVEGRIGR